MSASRNPIASSVSMAAHNTVQPLLQENEADFVAGTGVATRASTLLPRELQEIHFILLPLSAVIGMGFFSMAGTVEAIGGPGAVMVAVVFNGLLAIAVSQDLSRMLRLWPIRGAHVLCIQSLLDEDCGIILGWLFWIAYLCCFAALLDTVADLVASFELKGRVLEGSSILTAIFASTILNLLDIHYLKNALLCLASIKICLIILLFLIMLWINPFVAHTHRNRAEKREIIFQSTGPGGIFGALIVSTFVFSSAFGGIEAFAALVMEADLDPCDSMIEEPNSNRNLAGGALHQEDDQPLDTELFSRPAWMVPTIATLIYALCGWIATENISSTDDRLSMLDGRTNAKDSLFINSGRDRSQSLGDFITIVLILVAWSTSATTLYVASRSLYGMALIHSGRMNKTNSYKDGAPMRFLSGLSRKSKFHVPWVAILVSSVFPSVFPILKFMWPNTWGPTVHCFVDIGTVSCLLVWGILSLTHWRLCLCLRRNKSTQLVKRNIASWMMKNIEDNRWYYLHAILSLGVALTCFFIIVVGSFVTYLYNPTIQQLIPEIVIATIFVFGTFVPKVRRTITTGHSAFHMVDLNDDENIRRVLNSLNAKRTGNYGRLERTLPTKADFYGVLALH